jgi:hypothetical protein
MTLTVATASTKLIADEGILNLFLNASWQNLLFFVMFAGVIVLGVNKLTKPQKEQNEILKDLANGISNMVKNNAVEEKSRDERHERYLYEISDVRDRVIRGFDSNDKDLKQINETLIRHNSTRCASSRIIKEVTNETNEE